MFWTIASSGITDGRYSAANFSRCTVAEVVALQQFIDRQKRIQVNAESITTARLCLVVIGALSGKNASPPRLEHFLPYDVKDLAREPEAAMTPATARVAQRLIRARKLPLNVVSVLAEELKRFSEPAD